MNEIESVYFTNNVKIEHKSMTIQKMKKKASIRAVASLFVIWIIMISSIPRIIRIAKKKKFLRKNIN